MLFIVKDYTTYFHDDKYRLFRPTRLRGVTKNRTIEYDLFQVVGIY